MVLYAWFISQLCYFLSDNDISFFLLWLSTKPVFNASCFHLQTKFFSVLFQLFVRMKTGFPALFWLLAKYETTTLYFDCFIFPSRSSRKPVFPALFSVAG